MRLGEFLAGEQSGIGFEQHRLAQRIATQTVEFEPELRGDAGEDRALERRQRQLVRFDAANLATVILAARRRAENGGNDFGQREHRQQRDDIGEGFVERRLVGR